MYAPNDDCVEVPCDGYRVDAVDEGHLVEIQHGSLAAIRDKVRRLLRRHHVRVVKPIIVRKTLVKLSNRGGDEVGRRLSPKRGQLLDLFDELVYFTRVFPHDRLTLEALLVDVEETRFPGSGRRRRRRRGRDFQVADQRLIRIAAKRQFRTAEDLCGLLPKRLPREFHTAHLAKRLKVPRWTAQKIAYCLRETGGLQPTGKQGNAILYVRTGRAA